MEVESMVTIATSSGLSETLPVSLGTTSVKELSEWCVALFGMQGEVHLLKDGRRLDPEMKLDQAGVAHGDLLAAQEASAQRQQQPPAAGAPAGGLDFSSLLQSAQPAARAAPGAPAAASTGGGLDFSNLLMQQAPANNTNEPVYYNGMHWQEAWDNNPKPEHIVKLLQTHDNLFKQFNYHVPHLIEKIQGQPYEKAVQIWREQILKYGIQGAMKSTNTYHKEQDFRRRLQENPNDENAKAYFDDQNRRVKADEQYRQMQNEYPESLGRVLMLYIEAKVNGHSVQAFVDSGAQSTIMSKRNATACGIMDVLDTRFKGVAVGVGTGVILGRCHIVQLQLGDYYFPCTITIMDDPPPGSDAKEMPFLLGLDMLKRHTCSIDLENQVLKFRLAPGQYMETPFLHEKDLDEAQGGTKGFDADRANKELDELRKRDDENDEKGGKDGEDD